MLRFAGPLGGVMSAFVLLSLLACGDSHEEEHPAEPAPAAPAEPPAAPEPPPAPAAAAEVWTVVSLTGGDIACYVELSKAEGATESFPSDFALCPGGDKDASALIGKAVDVTFEKIRVQSPECQGDPECTKSVEEKGVATLTARP